MSKSNLVKIPGRRYKIQCGVYTHSGRYIDCADDFHTIDKQWQAGKIIEAHDEHGRLYKLKATDVAYLYEA